ncbi:hypothetical protein HDU96_005097, partial [Phlyctochytrium bullatum]
PPNNPPRPASPAPTAKPSVAPSSSARTPPDTPTPTAPPPPAPPPRPPPRPPRPRPPQPPPHPPPTGDAHRLSRTPLAQRHPDLLLNPTSLLLAGLLIAEAHLADVQTSTAVWAQLAGFAERKAVARLKRLALAAVEHETFVGAREYVEWLGWVRAFIQE